MASQPQSVYASPDPEPQPESAPRQLELTGGRTVSFFVGDTPITYHLRQLNREDWLRFFAGIVIMSEGDEQGRTDVIDTKSPSLALVEAAVLEVEGYRLPDGGDLMKLENWKSRLPYGHKLRAGELLQECGWEVEKGNGPVTVLAEYDQVTLSCLWNSDKPGMMTAYNGLVHKFRPASARQQQRMARASSEAKVINMGKGRAGRTVYPGRHEMLVEMYDELIAGVEGYSFSNGPLTVDRGIIISAMDTFHKVTAVQKLFAPVA